MFLERKLHDYTQEIARKRLITHSNTVPLAGTLTRKKTLTNLNNINTKAAKFITENCSQTPYIATRIKQQTDLGFLHIRRKIYRLKHIMNKFANDDRHSCTDINTLHKFQPTHKANSQK